MCANPRCACCADMRRISTPAWEQLRATYKGGPQLQPTDACPTCLADRWDCPLHRGHTLAAWQPAGRPLTGSRLPRNV